MTHQDLLTRWSCRRDEWKSLGVTVDGAAVCEEFIADLERLQETQDNALLTLTEAARESGYSADHLGRLVRDGKIPNAGRGTAPRIRRADLPQKPNLRSDSRDCHLSDTSKTQIARSIVKSSTGETR